MFMKQMLGGVWQILSNIVLGIGQIFNFGVYSRQLASFQFGWAWLLVIMVLLLAIGIWGALVWLIILAVRKYVRFRHTIVGKEDLLEEIAELHRDVIRLTAEKERIMNLKVTQAGLSYEEMQAAFGNAEVQNNTSQNVNVNATSSTGNAAAAAEDDNAGIRFARLSAVDEQYVYYQEPHYNRDMNLRELCEDIRNFACSERHLYYEIKTIRLMIAGLASTKLIVLQGISGTGKTSLPYTLGKYFQMDATIASVQPSWRDRSELFGYFNEFTKKFNETEVLKRIYESSYNDDINIIVLDEMNIARIEYYFAEMLSVLEMPNPNEWQLELVSSSWDTDPKHLVDGKLRIPQNVWYIGTANNDDSTFAVSDKVYDRALVINLDSKGVPFSAPHTEAKRVCYTYVETLYREAVQEHPIGDEILGKIERLETYIIDKFRIAFGNRIMKQLKIFVPVYVACGGDELDGVDYILATKVLRKFESLNLTTLRAEVRGLILFLDNLFGKDRMQECIAYLRRMTKTA